MYLYRLTLGARRAILLLALSTLALAAIGPAHAGIDFRQVILDDSGVDGLHGAISAVVSPDGAYIYVGAETDGAITILARDTASGGMTYLGTVEQGLDGLNVGTPQALALSPDGAFLYAAEYYSDMLMVFARDAGTGALTPVQNVFGVASSGTGTIEGLEAPIALVVNGAGSMLYVLSDHGSVLVFARDAVTGELAFVEREQEGAGAPVVSGLVRPVHMLLSPDEAHLYVAAHDADGIVIFDVAPGGLTYNSTLIDDETTAGLKGPIRLAMSAAGTMLYVASETEDKVGAFSRDPSDGSLTFVNAEPGFTEFNRLTDLLVSPDGAYLYLASVQHFDVRKYAIDGVSGALSPYVSGSESFGPLSRLVVAPDQSHVYGLRHRAAKQGPTGGAVLGFTLDGSGDFVQIDIVRDGQDGVDGLAGVAKVLLTSDDRLVITGSNQDAAVTLFERNVATGELNFVEVEKASDEAGGKIIALSPDDAFVYDHRRTFAVNAAPPGLDEAADDFFGLFTSTRTISPDGAHLYRRGSADLDLFVRDVATGALTAGATINDGGTDAGGNLVDKLAGSGEQLLFDSTGQFLYVPARSDAHLNVFERDDASGELTLVQEIPTSASSICLALSPGEDHLYLCADDIQVFDRAADTGLLTLKQTVTDGVGGFDFVNNVRSLAVSASGTELYAANDSVGGAVAILNRDPATGMLTYQTATVGNFGGAQEMTNPAALALSADDASLYLGANGSLHVFDRSEYSPPPASLAQIQGFADGQDGADDLATPVDVIVSPDGAHVYVISGENAITVFDAGEDGLVTYRQTLKQGVGGVEGLANPRQMELSLDGRSLYVVDFEDRFDVFARETDATSPQYGELTFVESHLIEDTSGFAVPSSVAVSPDGRHVYLARAAGAFPPFTVIAQNDVTVFARDRFTGRLTFLLRHAETDPAIEGLRGPSAIAVSRDGARVYVGSNMPLQTSQSLAVFDRDTASGALTFVRRLQDDGIVGLARARPGRSGRHLIVSGGDFGFGRVTTFTDEPGAGLIVQERFQANANYVDLLGQADGLATDHFERYVVTADSLGDGVAVFQRDGLTHRLTFLESLHESDAGVTGLGAARAAAMDPLGRYIYVASAADHELTVLELDRDGDGIPNALDAQPDVPDASGDHDNDGIPDGADPDDDNDGQPDAFEASVGLDPFDPRDGALDDDQDTLTNAEEAILGTNYAAADTDGDGTDDARELETGRNPTSNEPAAIILILPLLAD